MSKDNLIKLNRIEGVNFGEGAMLEEEYENHLFYNCNFAGAKLASIVFFQCEFVQCDFSMASVKKASFRDVVFRECKLLGLRFDECDKLLLSFTFQQCILNFSSFFKLNIKKTVFKSCTLHEADFSEADMTHATLEECDLARAVFDQTNLEGADLRTAYNFSIDPQNNRLKKARFSKEGLAGLLDKHYIIIEN